MPGADEVLLTIAGKGCSRHEALMLGKREEGAVVVGMYLAFACLAIFGVFSQRTERTLLQFDVALKALKRCGHLDTAHTLCH